MPGLEDIAIQAAETAQTAHINRRPSVTHDLAPETSIDTKRPVQIDLDALGGADTASDVAEDEIPASILRPTPRRPQMPPLPDLRFEQSYLASIKDAGTWQSVAYITVRDQIFMPLAQGLTWTLLVAGWRHWNSTAQFTGHSAGSRIRRWWWGVNNWKLPSKESLKDEKVAEGLVEFYTAQSTVSD